MSDQPFLDKEEIAANEGDLLRGLLEAADDRVKDTRSIVIRRNGKELFAFRIRGLSESEYNDCNDKATTYEKHKKIGVRVPVETNAARYRCWLIYTATVDEDRAKLWNNKQAQQQLNVLNGPDLIEKVLTAGEKSKVIDLIDELSGLGDDESVEEAAKNS